MIENISVMDREQTATYTICVDGKKINPSSHGEVNLWGREDKPTFEDKRRRLTMALELSEDFRITLDRLISTDRIKVFDLNTDEKDQILETCRQMITTLSHRVKDMRELKVKKIPFSRENDE